MGNAGEFRGVKEPMAQSKKTKRALFTSVLSLLVCMAMLIASTFAWFTDSVTSGVNKIVAEQSGCGAVSGGGRLGNQGHRADQSVQGKRSLGPGYTEVVYLRVKNEGSLALKYKFAINVASRVLGKTADDADIDLSQYIKFGVVEVTAAYTADSDGRTAAREAVGESAVLISEGIPRKRI